MVNIKFPTHIHHRILELYRKDPLAFEARYILGLKPKEPYKRFIRSFDASTNITSYDEESFFYYQRARIQEFLHKINPINLCITMPFMGYKLTEKIDHVYENTIVLFSFYTPPSSKAIQEGESLRLPLATVCAEYHFKQKFENFEYWHLKGYKDIVSKTKISRKVIDEALCQIHEWMPRMIS